MTLLARVTPALLAVAGACGGSSAAPDAVEPLPVDTAVPPDASMCVPLGACDWLDLEQQRIVGALSGEIEISPGVRMLHRASAGERAATRLFLQDEFTALGYTPTTHDYATGKNVVATLDATTGTGGLIIVGAHFDSVPASPGAADNATGVAIVLATARYLRELPVRHHPVAFVLFDEEELGLKGSKAYAASLVTAGTDVTGAHIFDMLSFDGDGDRAVELWSPSPQLTALYEQHGTLANTPIQPVTFSRSDHQAFLDVGLPAVGIGEEFVANDHTPHYHLATDTYDRVSFAHLAVVTHLAMAVLDSSVATP